MALMHIPADFDPTMPIRKAMEKHGIAKMTVIRWRKRCGTETREPRLAWTEQDIHTLRTNFNSKSFAQLSAMLGRTEAAIRTKAISIGLRKSSGTFTRDVRASFHASTPRALPTWPPSICAASLLSSAATRMEQRTRRANAGATATPC